MTSTIDPTRRPWNRCRLIGPKPPFKPKHIWAICTRLQHEGRTRDLALFSTSIDSKLRGCDLVRLRVAESISATASACAPPSSRRSLAGPHPSS